jgi:hypothetical protein
MPPDGKAAAAAFLAISTAPNSTTATIELLRQLGDAHGEEALHHVADRLEGIAARPGPKAIDDTAALARVAEFERAGFGREAVGMVARMLAPRDEAAQVAHAVRLRRKRRN